LVQIKIRDLISGGQKRTRAIVMQKDRSAGSVRGTSTRSDQPDAVA
jgi:hypothetical protein